MTEGESERFPSATSVPGVGVAQLRVFAAAFVRFYDAEPWQLFSNEDVIRINAPRLDPLLGHTVVLGQGGTQFGLLLFERESDAEKLADERSEEFSSSNGLWSVTLWNPHDIPYLDHDLWEDEGLPTLHGGMIPLAVCLGPKFRIRRPSPRVLAFFEALLLAIAESSEEEIDSGRWRRRVQASSGEVELSLSMPALLEPVPPAHDVAERPTFTETANIVKSVFAKMGEDQSLCQQTFQALLAEETRAFGVAHRHPPSAPERATQIARLARRTRGRRRYQLARQALAIWPECIEAFRALATAAPHPTKAVEYLVQAVAIADRIDPSLQSLPSSRAEDFLTTGLDARFELADALWAADRRDEAIEGWRGVLRLDPLSFMEAHHRLVPALLATGSLDEADSLIEEFRNPGTAFHLFNHALLAFRREGAGQTSARWLRRALEANPHVAPLLLEERELPDKLASEWAPGSLDEAALYAFDAGHAWLDDAAAGWLRAAWRRYLERTKIRRAAHGKKPDQVDPDSGKP